MTSPSYTRWEECVNSGPSKLPNVIRRQQSLSYDRIFRYLYRIADADGRFELHADAIVEATGYSRKTIYKVVKFLQRVNLLFLMEARTGRGRHSRYQLNWKKPARTTGEASDPQKCHPPKNPKSINTQRRSTEASATDRSQWEANPLLRCRYLTSGWNRLRKGEYGYKRAAKLFRLSCWSLGLPNGPSEAISGLLLRRLEGQSAERVRQVHDRLFAHLWDWHDKLHSLLDREIQRLCGWIARVLQRLLADIHAEEGDKAQDEATWAEAQRQADRAHIAWLAELKRSSLDRRRLHCQNALRLYVVAWEDLHGERAPDDVVDARCAELAAEFDVPVNEIYAGGDPGAVPFSDLIARLDEEAIGAW